MTEKLAYFDPNTCNLCNNGIAKEIQRLMAEDGLSIRKAAEQIEADIQAAAGDVVLYSAESIRSRFKNTVGTGAKTPTKREMTEEQANIFANMLDDMKKPEKNVLAAVLTTPRVTNKEFRAIYSGSDNLLSKVKQKVADAMGVKSIDELADDHPVFQDPLKLALVPPPKYKPGMEPKPEPPPEKKKKEEPKVANTMDLQTAQKTVGLAGCTHISKATLGMIEAGYKAKWEGKEKKLEKLTQAIGILELLTKK